ncbi:thiolase family protein (plasmid) [Rhodococcus erythropolis]|uniref:thiolase family protein n=1 Tax=Rhodococcus TaxID=1827 RepID=UPI0009358660|nr:MULTISPECIES: thiolase family protein [Rhodococcus]MCJ0949766.1 thiolase family protein [Rhodococcus sp. ARC_M8]MCZ4547311.1 thiolase family protein [Rhodococcus qingshengii]MDJ0441083.1 thiolase family protein [Rhodococcus qingshengii]OKA12518.1 acetyl-CoA acetyltransferase [Rhodococcus erythropolis]QEX08311.1 thiolase family protein [Rhodococcus erythropolis]
MTEKIDAVIVAGARTAIGTAFKGTLRDTSAMELAEVVVDAVQKRSGLDISQVDDIILAESNYGGGDIARHAAVVLGMLQVPGQAINRHCAGGLTAIGNAAGQIISGAERAIIAGGTQSTSTGPIQRWRTPGSTVDEFTEKWMPPTHPDTAEAPNMDMSITVGWNTAKEVDLTREEMDAWAFRSHQRAVAAVDAGMFDAEIVPVQALQADGTRKEFAVDEHPRRDSSLQKLASLKVLHPEIEGFSITAGNASGMNDAAAAVMVVGSDLAAEQGLPVLATVKAWAATAIDPALMGLAVLDVIPKVLDRAGITVADVALWEINEAFASVPVAACKKLGIDESIVNVFGSGCSLGHPVAASGARMVISLMNELGRRGGGYAVAAMCAGGGQAGAVVLEIADTRK